MADRDADGGLWSLRSLPDRALNGVEVAANAFELTVDNKLRCVNAIGMEHLRLVLRLAGGECGRRKLIPPPQPIPVIHVLAQGQHLDTPYRLPAQNLTQHVV